MRRLPLLLLTLTALLAGCLDPTTSATPLAMNGSWHASTTPLNSSTSLNIDFTLSTTALPNNTGLVTGTYQLLYTDGTTSTPQPVGGTTTSTRATLTLYTSSGQPATYLDGTLQPPTTSSTQAVHTQGIVVQPTTTTLTGEGGGFTKDTPPQPATPAFTFTLTPIQVIPLTTP